MNLCSIHGLANDDHGVCPKCLTDPMINVLACDRCEKSYPEHVSWPPGEGLCSRCVQGVTDAIRATSRTLYGSPVLSEGSEGGAPTKGQICLEQLRRVQLSELPEVYRRKNCIPLEAWAWGVVEAERRDAVIRKLPFQAPYPIRSYCLGLAWVREDVVKLLFWLFPCVNPETQDQAVAGLSIKGPLGGKANAGLQLTVDALAESELSPQNLREIREATRGG